jgi:hypothetical protein
MKPHPTSQECDWKMFKVLVAKISRGDIQHAYQIKWALTHPLFFTCGKKKRKRRKSSADSKEVVCGTIEWVRGTETALLTKKTRVSGTEPVHYFWQKKKRGGKLNKLL